MPIFGALSDRTNTKRGKRTPYIFFGTICAAILLTGVSLFDNAQNSKIEQAKIGDIITEKADAQDVLLGVCIIDEHRIVTKVL